MTAAASLIKRSEPAEWTLLSSNTGNKPDWIDFKGFRDKDRCKPQHIFSLQLVNVI